MRFGFEVWGSGWGKGQGKWPSPLVLKVPEETARTSILGRKNMLITCIIFLGGKSSWPSWLRSASRAPFSLSYQPIFQTQFQ